MRSSWREFVAVIAGAFAAAIFFTYPMAFRLSHLGRIDSTDGEFSVWNVAWVSRALVSPSARVLDANIFQPRTGTLAYSEANLGAGILGVPFYLVTGNGQATHNGAVLLGFVLSALAMYLLARRLTGSWGAAAVSAILFAYCPLVFARTPHIQLLMIWVLPACLLALHVFVDRPSWPRAVGLGVSLAVAAIFCAYYGILGGLIVGLGAIYYGVSRGHWAKWRYWCLLVSAALLSGALVWPLFRHYRSIQDAGFARKLEESASYAADWRAYLASSSYAHEWMLPLLGHWQEVLFPGFLAIVLGLAGLVIGLRSRALHEEATPPACPARETARFYALVAAICAWSSFGPNAGLYAWLYHVIPVFSFLRAPGRFGIAVSLSLCVLAALAVRALLTRYHRRQAALVSGLLVLSILDLRTASPLREVPRPDPAYAILASLPRAQVIELPYWYRVDDFMKHSDYMYNSTYHWQGLVNGYSDFLPKDFVETVILLASFPNPEGFQLLYDKRARYAVFHPRNYNNQNRATLYASLEQWSPYLKLLSRTDDVLLYEITGWPEFVRKRPPVTQLDGAGASQ